MEAHGIRSIAWITHGRSRTLPDSIASFRRHAERLGRTPELVVFDARARRWLPAFKEAACRAGVDPQVISFALEGLPGDHVTTGANRNAALLALRDQCFLSVDDDAFLTGLGVESEPRFDAAIDPFHTRYFSSAAELDEWQRTRRNGQLDFFGLHEKVIATGAPISVSGISGDSGCATPRLLFSLPGKFSEHALSNRLVHRQVDSSVLSPHALVMTPCVALDNRRPLPPFFPMGRNQDGAYGYLLKAFFPGASIGHVSASIEHRPDPPRRYAPDVLATMRFRFNDLLILLVSSGLAARLGELARMEAKAFLDLSRRLYTKAIEQRCRGIEARMEKEANPAWLKLVRSELALSKEIQTRSEFAIPVECLTTRCTQEWLGLFAGLLEAWPTLREISPA